MQGTPILFFKESNLQTQTDPLDKDLSKLEIHMVVQDITKVDHGKVLVPNGQIRSKNKLDIKPNGQLKECSGSLLNFSLKTGETSVLLTLTTISLIPNWDDKITLQLKG